MKHVFATTITLIAAVSISACRLFTQIAAPSVTPPPSATPRIPSHTPTPEITATPTLFYESSDLPTIVSAEGTGLPSTTQDPVFPTYLPTLEPEQLPSLLRDHISIKTLSGVNGHSLKRITGWGYGFRKTGECNSFQWLDANHMILYPRTGEEHMPYGGGSTIRGDLSSAHTVINLDNGHLWLRPPGSTPAGEWDCDSFYWSQELGLLINQQEYGINSGPVKEAVVLYTFDGTEMSRYWGTINGVSPSGTKILVDEDSVIDLHANKIIDLAWHMNYDLDYPYKLYWSSDETRLYRCCFYFADLKTAESYNLEWSELQGSNGKTIPFSLISPHVDGQWVRNDTYIFPKWDYWSFAGDPVVIFSPIEKKYFYVSGSSDSAMNPETITYTISPDGKYVWIRGYSEVDGNYHSFLVNIDTLESTSYDEFASDFTWSPNSKYGWTYGYEPNDAYMLSAASKKLSPFPVNPQYEDETATWHPKDSVLAYTPADDQSVALLNAADMTVQEWKLSFPVAGFYWSPDGNRMAFVSSDGSLWQGDYPKFQNVEQLTEPLPGVRDVFWSPEGDAIAFVSGPDIYIVETDE